MDILKELKTYHATEEEIREVSFAISKKGYYEKIDEWRISTVMVSTIEPQTKKGKTWFITTVKCEQKVKIPAASIERAITFMKIYQDFQIELFYSQGWASHEK